MELSVLSKGFVLGVDVASEPYKLLRPYVKAGMTVMDDGCGPGFFTLDLAEMVGRAGG